MNQDVGTSFLKLCNLSPACNIYVVVYTYSIYVNFTAFILRLGYDHSYFNVCTSSTVFSGSQIKK